MSRLTLRHASRVPWLVTGRPDCPLVTARHPQLCRSSEQLHATLQPVKAASTQPGSRAALLRRVRRRILDWYAVEKRDFPWRRTSDPWSVLVSEVMLQQTQASRVAERFPRFVAQFPTPAAIATARPAEVLAAWSGLGYNRRALALQRAGAAIAAHGWPSTVEGLERLPGIGRYTSRAVAALAFGQPVGAVDTNVRRWLVRRFGLPPGTPPSELQELADGLATADRPTPGATAMAWMHASMEFGVGVCAARAPACATCPIRTGCPSRGRAAHVPVTRQPAFTGSERAARGRLVRALATAADHRLTLADAMRLVSEHDLEALMTRLEHEGLAHRASGWVRLGGSSSRAAPSTIGP
jgi:A/G-specific adenine glycosylase